MLFGRIVTPKIRNRILPGLFALTGVDMGSAMSPLLFCLALDPSLHLVHCIPRIRVVRAYMDDNQIAGDGLDWIGQAQRQYQAFETAGLIAVQHRCCRFWPAHLPAPMEGKGVASWRIAALRSLSRYPQQLLFRCGGFPGTLTRREIWQIARPSSETHSAAMRVQN